MISLVDFLCDKSITNYFMKFWSSLSNIYPGYILNSLPADT